MTVSKTRWVAVVVIGALLAFLAYRAGVSRFDWQSFLGPFWRSDWRWLSASILLILFGNMTRAMRWRVMLPAGTNVSLWRLNSDTAIGFAAVALLGRVGEVVRPYLIASSAGLPLSSQVAAWLLERMLDLLAVLLMFGFALIRIPSHVLAGGGYVLALAGALCLGVFVVFRNFSGFAQARILSGLTFLREHHYSRAERMLKAFSDGLQCTRSLPLLAALLALTTLVWAANIASCYAALQSFPATARLTAGDVVVLLGFMAFGSMVQVPGIGGGIQVASIVAFTQVFGLSLEAASGISIFVWTIQSIAIVPFGLACAFHQGLNWSKLKLLSTKQILEDQQ